MKHIQTALLFVGIALTTDSALAATAAHRCASPGEFKWTSQSFDGEDFNFWTGVARNLVINARSKAQPKLGRAHTASSKLLAGAHTCTYDAETVDGQKFTAKAVVGGSK